MGSNDPLPIFKNLLEESGTQEGTLHTISDLHKRTQLQHIQMEETYGAKHGGEGTGAVSSSGAPCITDTHTKPECD